LLNFIKILLSPLVVVYGTIINIRNWMFDNGCFKAKRVNAKVISIGNITLGGSGKTPTTVYLSALLKNSGRKVGVLSRGYGRNTKGYKLISDGETIFQNVNDAGDEIYLVADECKVPAAVSERRASGAKKFLKDVDLEVIVLDDAYQHRWIHRDLDILIFEQNFLIKSGSIEQKLLPLGFLREQFSGVDRADIVLINRKFSEKKELPKKFQRMLQNKKVFHAYYDVNAIYDVKTHEKFNIMDFHGQKSLVVCGIARPKSFLRVLENHNIDATNKMIMPDHKEYTSKEIQKIRKQFYDTNAYSVLTTQKDAVKLTNYSLDMDDIDIYYLKIDLVIEKEDEFKSEVFKIFN